MMNPSQLQHQQTMTEGSAVGDETELIGEHDVSSVSTISKASSAFTDIDGKSQTIKGVKQVGISYVFMILPLTHLPKT